MFSVESMIYAWDNQLRYALALVADLTDEQMVLRPGGNMNHPAWILGHLAMYHPVTVQLLAGEPVDDPKNDPLFGFAGTGADGRHQGLWEQAGDRVAVRGGA